LYVNKYSIDLGDEGKSAITKMFNLAQEKGIIPKLINELFMSYTENGINCRINSQGNVSNL